MESKNTTVDLLTASKYLGFSYIKTRKLVEEGHLKAVNYGTGNVRKMRRIKVSELDRFLEEGVNNG